MILLVDQEGDRCGDGLHAIPETATAAPLEKFCTPGTYVCTFSDYHAVQYHAPGTLQGTAGS